MYNVLTAEGKKIFPQLKSFDRFFLAGGTGLALQINHRISVDFDLFCQDKITKDLLGKVEKVFNGREKKISVNNSDELTVFVDGVKITFIHYPFPVYSKNIEIEGVKVVSAQQIGLTKAYSIGRRGSYKDYVDLYFLLKGNYLSLEDIVRDCQEIFGGGFSDRLFLEQLVYMKDVPEIEVNLLQEKVSKKDLENYFTREIKEFGSRV